MQGYKVKEKQQLYPIAPPVSKLSGHPAWHNRVKLNRDIHVHVHFTCILRLLNNTCIKHYFKSVHVSNLFWSREYNSAKEICKYPSFSKVGGNYPLDLKIIWSSVISRWQNLTRWWLATTFKIIGKHHFYFKVSGGALECYIHLSWLFTRWI
jgi:hypothetical protein